MRANDCCHMSDRKHNPTFALSLAHIKKPPPGELHDTKPWSCMEQGENSPKVRACNCSANWGHCSTTAAIVKNCKGAKDYADSQAHGQSHEWMWGWFVLSCEAWCRFAGPRRTVLPFQSCLARHPHCVTQWGTGGTTEQLLPSLQQATVYFTNTDVQSPVTPSGMDFTISFKSKESKTW